MAKELPSYHKWHKDHPDNKSKRKHKIIDQARLVHYDGEVLVTPMTNATSEELKKMHKKLIKQVLKRAFAEMEMED